MKKYSQFIVEDHDSAPPTPVSGSPLYHVTNKKFDEPSKMAEKKTHPLTWFTSGSKGHDGHEEASEGLSHWKKEKGAVSRVHVRSLNKGVKLASESDVKDSLRAIHGEKATHHGFEEYDRNWGDEKHAARVDKLVDHLKKRGFHGIHHEDTSIGDDFQKTTHVVALFHPNKSSTYVKDLHSSDEVMKHQKKYEKGLNNPSA